MTGDCFDENKPILVLKIHDNIRDFAVLINNDSKMLKVFSYVHSKFLARVTNIDNHSIWGKPRAEIFYDLLYQ